MLWSEEEIAKLRKLCGGGKYSWNEIAERMDGRTVDAIRKAARERGIKNMYRRLTGKPQKSEFYVEKKITAAGVELKHGNGMAVKYE